MAVKETVPGILDSARNEAQAIGFKKKSERKRPRRKQSEVPTTVYNGVPPVPIRTDGFFMVSNSTAESVAPNAAQPGGESRYPGCKCFGDSLPMLPDTAQSGDERIQSLAA